MVVPFYGNIKVDIRNPLVTYNVSKLLKESAVLDMYTETITIHFELAAP